jgi:hypothetical protein
MRITRLSGTDIIRQFRSSGDIARFPAVVFLLVPDLTDNELDELVSHCRRIDRVTGTLILVVLFSKPPNRRCHRSPSDYRMRLRMLEGDATDEDRTSLLHGFVDEATALATALDIPLSDLPCIVIIDDPSSSEFYKLPYKGVEGFDILCRSVVDDIRKRFPDVARLRDRERQLEETLERAAKGPSKAQRKTALRCPECVAVLDKTLARLPQDDSYNSARARNSLVYLKNNPSDRSAMQKLELILRELEIPSPSAEFSSTWGRQSEIEAFGAPIEELKAELDRSRTALATLPRADLTRLLAKVATREIAGRVATSLNRWISGATTVLERVVKLAQLGGPKF